MDIEKLCELDKAHLIHPITEFRKHEQKGPRIVTGGKGIRVHLGDGRSVIDGFSGLFNINVGHGRRCEIGDAVHEQMGRTAYYPAFWDFSTEPAILLAERLTKLFPPDRALRHLLFTTGGSDANETAIRSARYYHAVRGDTGRRKIVSRRQAYHGITRGAGSATTLPAYHILEEKDPLHIETASHVLPALRVQEELPGLRPARCAEDLVDVIRNEVRTPSRP